jgi:hypothetical protein
MPKCEWCGALSPNSLEGKGWIIKGGSYYCSGGCASAADTQTKYGGKKGFMAGMGQLTDGMGLGGGGMSADHMLAGGGKVALATGGLAVKGVAAAGGLAVKGVAAAGKALGKAIEQAKLKAMEKNKAEIINLINSVSFGTLTETEGAITQLFDAFDYKCCGTDSLSPEFKPSATNMLLLGIDEGVNVLRANRDDCDIKKLEKTQARLQKARLQALEIMSGGTSSGDETLDVYNKCVTVLSGVYLDGSPKFIMKEIDDLFKVLDSVLGFFGAGKKINIREKREIIDLAMEKIEMGMVNLESSGDSGAEAQIQKYQQKLEKSRQAKEAMKK